MRRRGAGRPDKTARLHVDVSWQDLLAALALMLVIEGVLPFLNPEAFRRALLTAAQAQDGMLRAIGLGAMILGCVLLYLVR